MKIVRIRQEEFLRLPVTPEGDRDEAFVRYVRSALLLAGIDPDGPLRSGLDARSGDIVVREGRQRLACRPRRRRDR